MSYSKLADLRNIFLENNNQASRGKAIIDRFEGKEKKLSWLLRHHSEEEIYEEETYLRDDIDYFLEYFSILGLAHITGYLTLGELQEDRREIIYYLNHKPLKRYYYEHYSLTLPQILLEALQQNRSFREQSGNSVSDKKEVLFHQFHVINQSIDNDDVNQLLWFLDNGASYDYNLDDLKQALNDTKRCFELRNRQDALGQSIRGFFLYLDFLQLFDLFLKRRNEDLDKSAYWMYHSYWFTRINKQLRSSIHKFFNGLEQYLILEDDLTLEESANRVNASRKLYSDILDRVVYNTKYNETFEVKLNQWRNSGTSGNYLENATN